MSAGRITNVALAGLVLAAFLSGLFANTIGRDWRLDPVVVHGVIALAIVVLSPWKSVVVRRGLARRRNTRIWSVFLLVSVLITVASGLAHSGALIDRLLGLSIMQIHVGVAVVSLALAVAHYRHHPERVRRSDLGRRGFLRLATLTGMASALWLSWQRLASADRRFTGSHERGSFDPESLPVTSWLDDRPPRTSASELAIGEGVIRFDSLGPTERLEAILDCTGGWYSRQVWEGVRLDHLLDSKGEWRSIEVVSATGYARRFPIGDLDRLWLAVSLGGKPLSIEHGFPARIVAPDRRGFWWVKWVVTIRPSMVPWWVQSPFPLT